ncbi:hypothetical protein BpHYR1_022710 [Brachionus plicatilis]|uniref:Uncharacterized protein n=1 Tax=Brachionus plicatilis TaxID=10195 RepID=A0A3M7T6Q8_BRAPC|nr:hypothetical protein BpHYR1_022710 [Brachionus plicatilis]
MLIVVFLLVGYSYQYGLSKAFSSEDESPSEELALKSSLHSYEDALTDEDFDELKRKLTLMLSKKEIDMLVSMMNNADLVKRDSAVKRPFNPQTRWGKRSPIARFNPQTRWG